MNQQIKEAVALIRECCAQGIIINPNDITLAKVLKYAEDQAFFEPEEKKLTKIVINIEGVSYIKNVFSDCPVEVMILNQIGQDISVTKAENIVNEFVIADSTSVLTNLESLKAQVVEKF